MTGPQLIVLDRDGVLNQLWHEADLGLVDSPARADQVRLMPHAAAAVRLINEAGVPCAVASNQPGVAKGKLSLARLREVTSALDRQLDADGARVDRYFYCLHHPQAVLPQLAADCPNRKPRPGLLHRACRHFGVSVDDCWFIGDTNVDIQAGAAAGCHTAWIGPIRCDRCPTRAGVKPTIVAPDLFAAATTVLEGRV